MSHDLYEYIDDFDKFKNKLKKYKKEVKCNYYQVPDKKRNIRGAKYLVVDEIQDTFLHKYGKAIYAAEILNKSEDFNGDKIYYSIAQAPPEIKPVIVDVDLKQYIDYNEDSIDPLLDNTAENNNNRLVNDEMVKKLCEE
jgi:hypothetical protein